MPTVPGPQMLAGVSFCHLHCLFVMRGNGHGSVWIVFVDDLQPNGVNLCAVLGVGSGPPFRVFVADVPHAKEYIDQCTRHSERFSRKAAGDQKQMALPTVRALDSRTRTTLLRYKAVAGIVPSSFRCCSSFAICKSTSSILVRASTKISPQSFVVLLLLFHR